MNVTVRGHQNPFEIDKILSYETDWTDVYI